MPDKQLRSSGEEEEEDEAQGLCAAATGEGLLDDRVEVEDMPPLEDDHNGSIGIETTNTNSNSGDVFLLLDLPPNSTVGCDTKAIGTGSAKPAAADEGSGSNSGFQGIHDIPPGTHFIWVSEPNAMSRCGYWFVTHPKENNQQVVRVKQWDKFNEVLVDPASQFEVRDLRENVASLLPQLIPYGFGGPAAAPTAATITATRPIPTNGGVSSGAAGGGGGGAKKLSEAELWQQLTCCITEKVLSRVTGKTSPVSEWLIDTSDTAAGENGGVVGPMATASYHPNTRDTKRTTAHNAHHKAVYQTLVGSTGELNFLFPEGDIDLHEHYAGSNNHEQGGGGGVISTPDTSLDILRLVDNSGTGVTGKDLVGELQLTFLTGLHLSNLSCVDQWWHLVLKVFLRAHELLVRRPSLSLSFLQTLHAQIVYNEEYIVGGTTTTPSSSSPATQNNHHQEEEEEKVGIVDVRHEYGGIPGGATTTGADSNAGMTSLLDIVPGNKKKLRAALTLYKRRMNEMLLDFAPGDAQRGSVTPEQTAVGRVFAEMEAWFWRLGWDLRTDYVNSKPPKTTAMVDGGDGYDYDDDNDQDDDDDDEYKPVIVDLDENGREVGMVSFH